MHSSLTLELDTMHSSLTLELDTMQSSLTLEIDTITNVLDLPDSPNRSDLAVDASGWGCIKCQ